MNERLEFKRLYRTVSLYNAGFSVGSSSVNVWLEVLTPADGGEEAVGSEVSTSEPSSQLTQLHIHQPLLDHGNCSHNEDGLIRHGA